MYYTHAQSTYQYLLKMFTTTRLDAKCWWYVTPFLPLSDSVARFQNCNQDLKTNHPTEALKILTHEIKKIQKDPKDPKDPFFPKIPIRSTLCQNVELCLGHPGTFKPSGLENSAARINSHGCYLSMPSKLMELTSCFFGHLDIWTRWTRENGWKWGSKQRNKMTVKWGDRDNSTSTPQCIVYMQCLRRTSHVEKSNQQEQCMFFFDLCCFSKEK